MDKEKRIGIIISSDPSTKRIALSKALLALSLMEDNEPCQERDSIPYAMNFGRLTYCDPPYLGENKRDVYRKPLNKGRRR